MKARNIKALESLSFMSHLSGLLTVMLGIVVTFINVIDQNLGQIHVGIFIFASGYAFMKISSRITQIILDEKSGKNFSF
ncbi:hypothetical protein MNBD_BACTEROID05-125 [hydrothermal vent metagenome]|uniref:Uncharacterized protein n=1 Tax=hydrothermal vent metagenome TaxID=652676 RepID=A0A3B0U2W8_9ZZZZ